MNPEKIRAALPRASTSFLRINGLGGEGLREGVVSVVKATMRQKAGDGLNKTERAFFEYLKGQDGGARVYAQAITLKIANGCRYTPDFVVVNELRTIAYEVKGFMRDDAAVKLKVAAHDFPWIEFYLVTRPDRLGDWRIEQILP